MKITLRQITAIILTVLFIWRCIVDIPVILGEGEITISAALLLIIFGGAATILFSYIIIIIAQILFDSESIGNKFIIIRNPFKSKRDTEMYKEYQKWLEEREAEEIQLKDTVYDKLER